MNASGENAESVDAFLERIASLNNKSTREDEERTRRLEDDILQGRRERQARRAGKCLFQVTRVFGTLNMQQSTNSPVCADQSERGLYPLLRTLSLLRLHSL